VAGLRGPGDGLDAVGFAAGSERPLGGLLVPVKLHQRSGLAERLGAALAEPGPVSAEAVQVDPSFATAVPGLSAAGDATAQMPSITAAIAAGSTAAGLLVGGLATEGRHDAEPGLAATAGPGRSTRS